MTMTVSGKRTRRVMSGQWRRIDATVSIDTATWIRNLAAIQGPPRMSVSEAIDQILTRARMEHQLKGINPFG